MNRLILDGHLDLAMNAIEWNRDLTQDIHTIREAEKDMNDLPDRGKGTISFNELRKGKVGLCIATQIARYVKPGNKLPGWKSPYQAWAITQAQLAWYNAMEEAGFMVQITNKESLITHMQKWENPLADTPLGYILGLEGADSLITIGHLERAYNAGLRVIGPAHYGPGTYAQGTDASGGLPALGKELLKEIEKLGMILDISHLNDECFWQAMNIYHGSLWASHNTCRVFVPHNRQLNDQQIAELIRRDSVIGVALDAWMLVPGWIRKKSDPISMDVKLDRVIQNIDHICQLAGNSNHAAIGSDLDGAFGKEQSPQEIETIADLQKIPDILLQKGYKTPDIENILHKNWIRVLLQTPSFK